MQPYQPHRIARSRVIVGLMIMAMLASCAAPAANRESTPSGGFSTNQSTPTQSTPSTTTKPGSSTTTPAKPASTSGKGAVSGRGSSGFGSSYGYSGKGGK